MSKNILLAIFYTFIFCTPVLAYDWSTNPGDGSKTSPYQISTIEQLLSIGSDETLVTKNYILTNDIVFDPNNNPEHVFKGGALIAPDVNLNSVTYEGNAFTGTIDGKHHTIFGLTFDRCGFHGGLIGQIGEEGNVSNLNLENVNIKSADYISSGDRSRYTGSICGINFGRVENCHVTGSLVGGERSDYLGGICGENSNIITHCSIDMKIHLDYLSSYVGGICGRNKKDIKSCDAIGEINCVNRAGGAGGICGFNFNGTILDSNVNMRIQGGSTIGGLCGNNQYGKIDNCHTQGSVSGGDSLGGICGANSGVISHSFSSCSISGVSSKDVGGFCGINDSGVINNCMTSGKVSVLSKARYIGGFCGYNSDSSCIINCCSSGDITGLNDCTYIGGLCGSNGATVINNCYAVGDVSLGSKAWFVAAFCGGNGGLINNCFAKGTVSATESYRLGGLCGANDGAINNCYSTSVVSSQNSYDVGGLCGRNSRGVISNSYWDIQTSGVTSSDGGIGLMTVQMKDINTYLTAGWDFENEDTNGTSQIWSIKPNEYPIINILSPGFSSHIWQGSGSVEDPYRIDNVYDIGAIYQDITASYKLMNDIDLRDTNWSPFVIPAYMNSFNGNGHSITNFSVHGNLFTAFFGILYEGAEIENLNITEASVTGNGRTEYSGIFCGCNQSSEISNCVITGNIMGGEACEHLGGVCGMNDSGVLRNIHADVNITTEDALMYTGGLCGQNYKGELTDCSATGSLYTGNSSAYIGGLCGLSSGSIYDGSADMNIEAGGSSSFIGGLCGEISQAKIGRCFASGDIYGGDSSAYLGGGVGVLSFSSTNINCCFASGNVTSGNDSFDIGGFVGYQRLSAKISNCYSTGSVSGNKNVGGFIGHIVNCTASNCYSVGEVFGNENTGGFVGFNYSSTIGASYWDIESSHLNSSFGGIGKTTDEMKMLSTFIDAGWDFFFETVNGTEDIWFIREGIHYPKLWWEHHRAVADTGDDREVYAWIDGLAQVRLDGTGSYDPDGDALEYYWFDANDLIATGAEPNVLFGVGEYEVTLIVNDGIEDSEPDVCVISVVEPFEALAGDIIELVQHKGIANSLLAKLDAARKKLGDGNENNDGAAVGSLGAFINAVNAQRGKKISEEDADSLITVAEQIINML